MRSFLLGNSKFNKLNDANQQVVNTCIADYLHSQITRIPPLFQKSLLTKLKLCVVDALRTQTSSQMSNLPPYLELLINTSSSITHLPCLMRDSLFS